MKPMNVRFKTKHSDVVFVVTDSPSKIGQPWPSLRQMQFDVANLSSTPRLMEDMAPPPLKNSERVPPGDDETVVDLIPGWWIIPMIALAILFYGALICIIYT